MMKSLFFCVALVWCGFTTARETAAVPMSEKIKESSLIFIGSTIEIRRESVEDGEIEIAILKVHGVILGMRPVDDVRFVTRGFIEEQNPHCCAVGHRYLIFARPGVDALGFSEVDDEFTLQAVGANKYMSGVNGPFSTCEVEGLKEVHRTTSLRKIKRLMRSLGTECSKLSQH